MERLYRRPEIERLHQLIDQARLEQRALQPLVLRGANSNQHLDGDGHGYSGMFPCFFDGLRSRFVARVRSASMSRGRVSRGSMTSST